MVQGSQQHQSESLDEMDMVCSVSEPANNDLVVERASRAWPTFGEERLWHELIGINKVDHLCSFYFHYFSHVEGPHNYNTVRDTSQLTVTETPRSCCRVEFPTPPSTTRLTIRFLTEHSLISFQCRLVMRGSRARTA